MRCFYNACSEAFFVFTKILVTNSVESQASKALNTRSPRITLSLGRASDGPRSTGDINARAIGMSIYLVWMFLAVMCPNAQSGFALQAASDSAIDGFSAMMVFLFVSTCALVAIGLSGSKSLIVAQPFKWSIIASSLCCIGTLGLVIGSAVASASWLGYVGAAVAALGSSAYVVLWGSVYMKLKFHTVVINSALSFSISYIVAMIIACWLPSQAAAVIAMLVPFCCIPAFRGLGFDPFSNTAATPEMDLVPSDEDVSDAGDGIGDDVDESADAGDENGNAKSEDERIVSPAFYRLMGKSWISLGLLGAAIGFLRVVCCYDLPSQSSLTLELVLFGGAAVCVLIFLVTLMLSRKETSWDHLFRVIVPIIIVGIALYGMFPDQGYFPYFFLVISFVSLEILVWTFLSCMAESLDASPEMLFGIGFGVIQLGALISVFAFSALIWDPTASTGAYIQASSPVDLSESLTQIGHMRLIAGFSLAMVCIIAIANAVHPRYHELKQIMVSIIPTDVLSASGTVTRSMSAKPIAGIDDSLEKAEETSEDPAGSGSEMNSTSIVDHVDDGDPGNSEDDKKSAALEGDGIVSKKDATLEEHGIVSGAENIGNAADIANPEGNPTAAAETIKGSFKRRCDEISDEYMLSAREQEVFQLLAKGHKAAFIMEELCISRSTAKTHINHIYKKLDIHTQQELMRMVENRKRGPN